MCTDNLGDDDENKVESEGGRSPLSLELGKIVYLLQEQNVLFRLNGWQLAKMKKSIPDMSLP